MRFKTNLILTALFLIALSVFAQATNDAVAILNPQPPPEAPRLEIFSAMFKQVVNNPSSLFVIAVISVIAWLIEITPGINSRWVPHFCVGLGAAFYWMFASRASVPVWFPYPSAVLVGNGIICGLVAYAVHAQLVARLLNYFRVRSGNTERFTKPENNP